MDMTADNELRSLLTEPPYTTCSTAIAMPSIFAGGSCSTTYSHRT